jgi:hypothetical protein
VGDDTFCFAGTFLDFHQCWHHAAPPIAAIQLDRFDFIVGVSGQTHGRINTIHTAPAETREAEPSPR